MSGQRVIVPQRGLATLRRVGCALEQLDADEDVLWEPTDEEN